MRGDGGLWRYPGIGDIQELGITTPKAAGPRSVRSWRAGLARTEALASPWGGEQISQHVCEAICLSPPRAAIAYNAKAA